MQKITPCLWFDNDGEEAARFYVSVFPNSRIVEIARYGEAGPRPEGTVMTVDFELDGQRFLALNGGPEYRFSEAISFMVNCETQESSTSTGARCPRAARRARAAGSRTASASRGRSLRPRCGELLTETDPETSQRVMRAMLNMRKIDIAELERAAGQPVGA